MNELERMKAGYWLHAVCPSIGAELLRGEELCFRLNQLPPSRHEEREAILRDLFGHLGEGCTLHSPFHCDFGTQIRIGIGDRVLIGPNVGIYTVSHALQPDQRAEGIMRSLPVRIGNDVWIGGHVVITQGVTIGDGAVIGAGSVVTHDIPARVIAAGNPCRVLRPITEEDRIREVS